MRSRRVAIVTTHPIQYYAPWFRWMAGHAALDLRVFYLWQPEAGGGFDPGFRRQVEWDVPLLEGYAHEFVPNTAARPSSARLRGIQNPELENRLGRFRPEAALLLGYRYESLLRLLFSRRRRFPLLLRGDSHRLSGFGGGLKKGARRLAIRAIFRRFAGFLYVGQANRAYLKMHGVPEERLFFSPHAIDNGRFSAAPEETRSAGMRWCEELGVPADDVLVLFAGKFEAKKRAHDLLRAFLALERPDVSLLLVGAGKLEGVLREAASGHPKVFFAPFQNQTLMPRTYAAADLFVLPSFGPEESWGLAINEALALGKPVVISDHVGCAADLVHPGENGWIYPAGDVAALTSTLKEALADRDRLKEYGAAGKGIVARYSYANATDGLLHALAAVCR